MQVIPLCALKYTLYYPTTLHFDIRLQVQIKGTCGMELVPPPF